MGDKSKTYRQLAKDALADIGGGPITTAPQIRALMNSIWYTTKQDANTDDTRAAMLMELSLLSGMACAVLHDYAKLLDRETTNA